MLKSKFITSLLMFVLITSIMLSGCNSSKKNQINDTVINEAANKVVDDFLSALESNDTSLLGNCLDESFHCDYEGIAMNKEEFLSLLELSIFTGIEYSKVELNNRISENINDNKVIIKGSLYIEATNMYGEHSNKTQPTEFTVEKKQNDWKITYYVE